MPTVLLIDDDNQIRSLLRSVLRDAGYQVLEAKNGHDGLHQCRRVPTDVVITDILNPEGDGLESISILRRDYPNTKIIAMTGGSGEQNFLDVAQQMGADVTLEKPFSVMQILDLVQQLAPVQHGEGSTSRLGA